MVWTGSTERAHSRRYKMFAHSNRRERERGKETERVAEWPYTAADSAAALHKSSNYDN